MVDRPGRVYFKSLRHALELVAATEESPYSVQLTTMHRHGAPGVAWEESMAAMVDFQELGWYSDAMEIMRDVISVNTPYFIKGGSGDGSRVFESTAAKRMHVAGFRKTVPPEVGRVWLNYLYVHQEHWGSDTSIDSLWRLAGKAALINVFVEAHDELGEHLWVTTGD